MTANETSVSDVKKIGVRLQNRENIITNLQEKLTGKLLLYQVISSNSPFTGLSATTLCELLKNGTCKKRGEDYEAYVVEGSFCVLTDNTLVDFFDEKTHDTPNTMGTFSITKINPMLFVDKSSIDQLDVVNIKMGGQIFVWQDMLAYIETDTLKPTLYLFSWKN